MKPTDTVRAAPAIRGRVLVTAGRRLRHRGRVVAIDLFDSGSPGRANVVDRAVAAVTRKDSVYHVVERQRVRRAGHREARAALSTVAESWSASTGRFHRKVFAVRGGRRGKLLQETAGRPDPGRTVGTVLMYNSIENTVRKTRYGRISGGAPGIDSSQDPGAGLRRLEQQGKLREAGTTRVGGRRAFRLTSGWISEPVLRR